MGIQQLRIGISVPIANDPMVESLVVSHDLAVRLEALEIIMSREMFHAIKHRLIYPSYRVLEEHPRLHFRWQGGFQVPYGSC